MNTTSKWLLFTTILFFILAVYYYIKYNDLKKSGVVAGVLDPNRTFTVVDVINGMQEDKSSIKTQTINL